MDLATNLIGVINDSEANQDELSFEETIAVINAVKDVSAHPSLLEKTINLLLLVENKVQQTSALTKRQFQVLNLIGLGCNTKEIASFLDISTETVGTHRKNIIKKLKLKGSRKLQSVAFEHARKNFNKDHGLTTQSTKN